MMVTKYLLVVTLQLIICFRLSQETVCRESDIMPEIYRAKPQYLETMKGWARPQSPRSLFRKLENCTVYHGDIIIQETNTELSPFDENIRYQDFMYLKNLERIYGVVQLDFKKYPDIKNLSFFSNLKELRTTVRLGFVLINSKVEMFGCKFRLGVPFAVIVDNKELCYMENFKTINRITLMMRRNRDPKECAREGKVCSRACNPRKGCWGPEDWHCFECLQWTARSDCVDSCESKQGFFTPSEGRVCGRCHEECKYGCFGPNRTQCYSRRELSCPKYMFFNNTVKQCEECSATCFGDGHGNRSQLISQACSGPGSWTGPGGCCSGCQGMRFLTVSSEGLLSCAVCHADCLAGCRNESLSGCFRIKPPKPRTTPAALETNQDRKSTDQEQKSTDQHRKSTDQDRKSTDQDREKARPMIQDKMWASSRNQGDTTSEVAEQESSFLMNCFLVAIGAFVGLICVLVVKVFHRIIRGKKRAEQPSQVQRRRQADTSERPPPPYQRSPPPYQRPSPPQRRREFNRPSMSRNIPPSWYRYMFYDDFYGNRTAAPEDVFLAIPLSRRRPGYPRRMNAEPVARHSRREDSGDRSDGDRDTDEEENEEQEWTGRRGWSQVMNPRNPVVICSGRRGTVLRMWSHFSNRLPPSDDMMDPTSSEC